MIRVRNVAVWPEGIDVDPAGGPDGEARVVLVRADADAESRTRHDPDNLVLYPALRRWGVVVMPLRRMGFGIAFSGFAWIAAGAIQLAIDGGTAVSIV